MESDVFRVQKVPKTDGQSGCNRDHRQINEHHKDPNKTTCLKTTKRQEKMQMPHESLGREVYF